MSVEQIYERYIKILTPSEKKRLMNMIHQSQESDTASEDVSRGPHSILELHGLGQEIWWEIDAQEYIDQLRSEWDK